MSSGRFAGVALVVCGCGPLPSDAFVDAFDAAVCAQEERCGPGSWVGVGDPDGCPEVARLVFGWDADASPPEFARRDTSACLRAIRRAECGLSSRVITGRLPPACSPVFGWLDELPGGPTDDTAARAR